MLEEAQSLALQLGDPAALAYATHMLGMSALFTDPTRAGELLREALALYGDDTANGTPDLVVALRLQLAMSYVFTGDLSSAYEEFQLCRSLCEPAGETWLRSVAVKGVALVEFCQGELTEAAAHARETLRMRRVFRDVFFLSMTLDLLAWILAAQNQAQQAAVLLGAASRQWSTIGRQMSGSKDWTARIEQCEERARDSLGGRGFAAAFSRGTELDVDAAIDYALGAEPHRAAEPATPEGPVLTRRQQEIAELVAEGLSNMEIAQRLVISRRTAEGHVEQILTKLDFRSRTQIATWVAERRSV
jgi:non-specific serine/threonine protein kinase